jgi:3-hydroxybutyryl-CoA dehydrogenase
MTVRRPVIAIVGLGTMGCGLAVAALESGLKVRVVDSDVGATRRSIEQLNSRLASYRALSLRAPVSPSEVEEVCVMETITEACMPAELVIEAVPEVWDIKRGVLGEISAATNSVVATNTSSFPIDDLASALVDPARFLGVHFFHPAEWIPGVEVIPGEVTSTAAIESALELLKKMGKSATVVRSSAGFVANRIQLALFVECMRIVDEGVATIEEIDQVVRSTFGFRLPAFGPFAIADMAGLDVYASILGTLAEAFGSRFQIPRSLRELVDAGNLGVKTGKGFRDYANADTTELAAARNAAYARLLRAVSSRPEDE